MQTLKLKQFPLDEGVRLIEASAGTGKTYTIANLYLRLLLEQDLSVDSILVVTFTEAATVELRERVRSRLHEALLALQGEAWADDELLQSLSEAQRGSFAELLQQELSRIDEAAIFTIHGFCKRILAEHAFQSGVPFELELEGDEAAYREQAAQDFWRRMAYGESSRLQDWWLQQLPTPEDLVQQLRPLLKDELTILPQPGEDVAWAAYEATYTRFYQALTKEWAELEEYLLHGPALNRQGYRVATMENLLAELEQFSDSAPINLPALMNRLGHDYMASRLKQGYELPEFVSLSLVDEIVASQQAWAGQVRNHVLQQARAFVLQQVELLKQQAGVLSFDDLLRYMDRALAGPHAEFLARSLRQRYPCAMIDEFQDTDSLQYRIFKRIYSDAGRLFLIGDPKQAIYGFRGADIFAYMQAKQRLQGQGYTLDTNWRSTTPLVTAVNQLFARASAPFIYDEAIPFHAVQAAGKADAQPLLEHGQQAPALQWWFAGREGEEERIKAGVYDQRVLDACCDEAARLLNGAASGEVTLGTGPLAARDIAFLVRSKYQGQMLQAALARRGLHATLHKDESVFESHEVQELHLLLRAILHYRYEPGLRAALASSLLGYGASRLDELLNDEPGWEAILQAFETLHLLWQRHGFMRMWRQLLQDFAVVARIKGDADADRRLTNLNHLAELIAHMEQQSYGMEALVRQLEQAMLDADHERDAEQLRLESEADLITIITIHKSKGLQYPLVFLPFIARGRDEKSQKKKDGPQAFHHPEHGLTIDLGSAEREEAQQRQQEEALAEDLRLLYVALTRAEQRCYVCWGAVKAFEGSAMAYLLYGGRDAAAGLDDAGLQAPLQALVTEHSEALQLAPILPLQEIVYTAAAETPQHKSLRDFERRLQRDWWVTSYSYLANRSQPHSPSPDYDAEAELTPPLETESLASIFGFPRGADAGQCLHAIFEHIDFTDSKGWPEVVAYWLQRHRYEAQWQPVVLGMLQRVLGCDLNGAGLMLATLGQGERLNELGFYFPLTRLDAGGLNAYLQQHSLPRHHPLDFEHIEGMMKGFIDLVLRHEGRYYLVDYKSNHLGMRSEDYSPERLAEAVVAHDYDLQYLIYTLALHRYLRQRLPGYEYEQHFGGVYYLFLRGMGPSSDHGVHAARPSLPSIEALEDLLCGGGHG